MVRALFSTIPKTARIVNLAIYITLRTDTRYVYSRFIYKLYLQFYRKKLRFLQQGRNQPCMFNHARSVPRSRLYFFTLSESLERGWRYTSNSSEGARQDK